MAAAIKEYNAILKKAQWNKSILIWRSLSGPTEMLRVDFHDKWSELDSSILRDPKLKEYETDLTRITARITQSFINSRRVIQMVNRDVSLPRPADPPHMLMIWTAHVKPGKMHDAIEMEKNDYAPAVKSAGIKSYLFATARFGAPASEIHASTGLDTWADFDQSNPIRKALGDDKYRTFADKMNTLLEDYRYDVYRFDPELSYIAPRR
jgi:hypothetical protein